MRHLLPTTAVEKSTRVIVFIEGYAPTVDERALAAAHSTKCFRTSLVTSPAVEPHALAVALKPEYIPKGYITSDVASEESTAAAPSTPATPAAPADSPAAPAAPSAGAPPWTSAGEAGSRIIASDD